MKKTGESLEEFLQWVFAEDYMGTDDDMGEACNDWIDSLSPKEVGDIAQEYFNKLYPNKE